MSRLAKPLPWIILGLTVVDVLTPFVPIIGSGLIAAVLIRGGGRWVASKFLEIDQP